MFRNSSSPFGRKKSAAKRPFAEFYTNWFSTLSATLLPQLRRALSSSSVSPALLSLQVDGMHHHFHTYYLALDQAAAADVAQCLHPEWRSSVEKPFLWLGDLHPYLFTNLLRSFLNDQESSSSQEDNEEDFLEYDAAAMEEFHHRPWHVAVAWRSPSRALTARVDQIECGLRLMVPALAARARHAQAKLVRRLGAESVVMAGNEGGGRAKAAVGEAMAEEMEELVGVVVDANRLRRSVLADVLSATTVYQAGLFFEAVAEFLVGLGDAKLVKEFEECDKCIN